MENIVRFKHYADIPAEIVAQAKALTVGSPWRQQYHIEPDTGFLNDPNGFSFFNGQYHLCYQWSPLRYCAGVWYQGWFHLTSTDLVNWQACGPLLEPETPYDSHGPYSGSAIARDNELLIFYTGNTRDEAWRRTPYQLIARMDKNGEVTRQYPPALTGQPTGYTDHFRDPKLWRQDGQYYAVVGAQNRHLQGRCVVLHSADAHTWQVKGEIDLNETNTGYMLECPDYFELEEQGIIICCPQGLCAEKTRQNLYEVHYLVGEKLNVEDLSFNPQPARLLDHGFDIYATQTMLAPDGRRLLMGWMGISEMHYPTEDFGHCGTLTLPRELSLVDGRLYQRPVAELRQLRGPCQQHSSTLNAGDRVQLHSGAASETIVTLGRITESVTIALRSDETGERKTLLTLDAREQQIVLDRTDAGQPINTDHGTRRHSAWSFGEQTRVHVFSDTTSLEIFIDEGAWVSSSRIFPHEDQRWLIIENKGAEMAITIDCWQLKGMNNDH